ncbi:hypothetical protein [Lysobacter sp. A289]
MKKTRLMAAMAAVTAGAVLASAGAHAQTKPLQVWQPPQHEEPDPAKRVPQAAQPVPTTEEASQPMALPQSSVVQPQPYNAAPPAPARYQEDRGGFFLGVRGGKGWVVDDVDQSALAVNAGYRWQAGAVTLVGIEAAHGRLDETRHDGWSYSKVEYTSIGATARFNFGATNPIYGLVRAGYWTADNNYGMDVDGGYFGVGLGVDITRNFNVSVTYTNHVYFNDYYWDDGEFYYDANRADTLMFGAEVRF